MARPPPPPHHRQHRQNVRTEDGAGALFTHHSTYTSLSSPPTLCVHVCMRCSCWGSWRSRWVCRCWPARPSSTSCSSPRRPRCSPCPTCRQGRKPAGPGAALAQHACLTCPRVHCMRKTGVRGGEGDAAGTRGGRTLLHTHTHRRQPGGRRYQQCPAGRRWPYSVQVLLLHVAHAISSCLF